MSSFPRDLTPIVSDERNQDVVAFYDARSNGYVRCDVTPEAVEATMVRVTQMNRADGTSTADRSVRFRIAAGNPDPQRLP